MNECISELEQGGDAGMSVAGKEAREEYWNEIGLQAVMAGNPHVARRPPPPRKK